MELVIETSRLMALSRLMCVCLGSTMSQRFYYINNMYNISMGFVFHVNLVEKMAK